MILQLLGFLQFTLVDLVDILLVALIIFVLFRWIRGSSAVNIFLAIILLLVIQVVAVALGMKMLSALLGVILDGGLIALIVIFQPEIRRSLNALGVSAEKTLGKRRFFKAFFAHRDGKFVESGDADEIAQACKEMSEQKVGALIVIRHTNSLEDIIQTGDVINSDIRKRLILNIFFKNAPLHDGAVIIGGGRIIAARCTLPITGRRDLPPSMGMRHKAAVGLAETYDSDVIVVSEQTGKISFVRGSQIEEITSVNVLKDKIGRSATTQE